MRELIQMLGMKYNTTRELLIVGLILGRTVPMIFMTPFLAGQQSPPEVKMSLGVLFTLLVWPLARDSMSSGIPIHAMPFLLLMLKEVLIGFAVGFAASGIFAAMETAGRFIDTARGAAMAEVLVPTSRQRATPIGTLYSQLLLVVFVSLGGHAIFMDVFFQSFGVIPLDKTVNLTPGLAPIAEYMIRITSDILLMAVVLSAPAIAATFITDLVFGILNRVAPQLNAYFMAMPVKAMGALILILVSLNPFIQRIEEFIKGSLLAVQNTIDLLVAR